MMRSIVLLTLLVSAFSLWARETKEPGYGKPPTYAEAVQAAAVSIGGALLDPASLYGFTINRPFATCIDRGHPGKADVCGYRMCVAFNAKNAFGGYVGFKSYLLIVTPRQGSFYWEGRCTVDLPWEGDPPVEVRDFCWDNPKHSICRNGEFKEDYRSPTLAESVARPAWMTASGEINRNAKTNASAEPAAVCSDEFKDQLRAKGMSWKDIGDVCPNQP